MKLKPIIVHPETRKDYRKIKRINDLAFNQENEGILIEKLRKREEFVPGLSLVAEIKGEPVGHILFFPLAVRTEAGWYQTISLAPLAVLPEFQNKGIGTHLVTVGLKRVSTLGFASVVVVGHPAYYPRFGFLKASIKGISVPFPCPDEALMALEFEPGALQPGTLEFTPEFFEAM